MSEPAQKHENRTGAPPAGCTLCVDLDGSLVRTDLLWESVLQTLAREPRTVLRLPGWLIRGKAQFKRAVASRAGLDPETLPYREEIVSFLREERARGRRIVLTTAADGKVARDVAEHLGVFSSVLASDGSQNLKGTEKLRAIEQATGGEPFDYIGDSAADLPIWKAARRAMVVAPTRRLRRRLEEQSPAGVDRVFEDSGSSLRAVLRALRPKQWVKNVLLFAPLLLAHQLTDVSRLAATGLAFFAFSLCASFGYVANDLLDLEHDRRHPRKRRRPFASGRLGPRTGFLLAPALFVSGVGLAVATQPATFVWVLLLYVVSSSLYSFLLKRVPVVDVVVLAGLYTIRVIAGGAAASVPLSAWFLAFSLFLFLSLALMKRYSELLLIETRGGLGTDRRNYQVTDLPMIRSLGPASGYMAVLVLALYINSDEVRDLYDRPELLWLVTPLLLFWVTRVWFLAHRGVVSDDPVVFTLTDRTSWALAGAVAALLAVSTLL